jgi:hypothetical protein
MIKTNRCFYRDSEQPLQFTKSQITLNPAWAIDTSELFATWKPQVHSVFSPKYRD